MKTRHRLMAVALLSGLAVLGAVVQAQAPPEASPKKTYSKKASFKLPLRFEAKERARIREVQLYVRSAAHEPAVLVQSLPPTQDNFIFNAPKDGEYWFNVATVDQMGKLHPADINKEPPGLIVVVDTQFPECEVRPMEADGESFFYCEVRDANPDPSKTKLEYLACDGTWRVLEQYPGNPGFFRIADPALLKSKVRAMVSDKAGNTGIHEIHLAMSAVAPAEATGHVPTVVESQSDKIALTSGNTPAAPETPTPAAPAPAVTPTAPTPTVAEMRPSTPQAEPVITETQAPAAPATTPPVLLVNKKKVPLAYEIDKLGSAKNKVEVWVTSDRGQTWQRLGEDQDGCSPVVFELPDEGLFGIRLVVSNFGGRPPVKGETPDCWIEVDLTRPLANLLAVRLVEPKTENLEYLITWTDPDKDLKPEPIDLYIARTREGPWMPIAKGLTNSGNYRWQVPAGLKGEVFVRLEATDLAGNSTRCDWPQAVVIDQARPKVRVLGIADIPAK